MRICRDQWICPCNGSTTMSRRPQPGAAAFETSSTWASAATSVLLCRNRSSYFYRSAPVTPFCFSSRVFLISPYISSPNRLIDTGQESWLTTRRHLTSAFCFCFATLPTIFTQGTLVVIGFSFYIADVTELQSPDRS